MTAAVVSGRHSFVRQTATGLVLAALVIGAWLSIHVYNVFFHRWDTVGIVIAPLLLFLQCWLSVGLFIVAHDCMHGSLAPFRPSVNLWVGRLCLTLYVGFSYDRLVPKHFEHHRAPGTTADPDFNDEDPEHFWRWYASFVLRYFGWRPLAFVLGVASIEQFALGAPTSNVLLLWALPAIFSSLQLFYFGTYLPHRHDHEGFTDKHNSRSNDFSWVVSLMTCFHFGYHHEHHVAPHVPWWRLPALRTAR